MRKIIFLLTCTFIISCEKLELVPTPSARISTQTQAGIIDQNFFQKGSKMTIKCLNISPKGEYTLECIPPILRVKSETMYYCTWNYIRADKGDLKSKTGLIIKVKPKPGSNVILTMWAERLGTNVKSDFQHAQYKTL